MIKNNSIPMIFYMKSESNNEFCFTKCKIYKNGPRYNTNLRGCDGNLIIIKLSDGRFIKTNDLWYELDGPFNETSFKTISINDLIGEVIPIDYKEVDKLFNVDEEYIYPIIGR
jgi:hypothetical protein